MIGHLLPSFHADRLAFLFSLKRLVVVLVLGAFAPALFAQHWITKTSSPQADHIADLVLDGSGNSYVIGDFSLGASFTQGINTLGSLNSAGGRDVLVAKFAPDGSLLWAKRAGGNALDVGLKLVLGTAGLGITGLFTGTADLFGSSHSAQGGSTDLFVALLDPANGNALWVRTAGAPGYTDTPGGITMRPNGDIVLAGKFKGDAVFGTDTLHSAFDPWTSTLGFDVFIASWASDGTYQWVRQGSGPHDDQAVELTSGPDGMLYITGQFSDTITFGVEHPNISLNSMFVVKYDGQGQEQWYRKCGGSTFNQVSDILFSSEGDLLIAGDVANTMYWVDNIATPIPNPEPHAYFILRVDTAGTLLRATTMGSVSNVHAASITEQADSVVVYGEFECSFTGLQDAYNANGLFMATGLKDLFIAKHLASDLSFVEAQQFGGSGAKRAGAVAWAANGLLFTGSFEQELFLPRSFPMWGDPVETFPFGCSYLVANAGLTYCGDPNYGYFAWAVSQGLSDGFLSRGYEETRQPYDWWKRQNTPPCDRSDRGSEVCISEQYHSCTDTIEACGYAVLMVNAPFPTQDDYCGMGFNIPTVGPYAYQWWNGAFPFGSTVTVSTTGWVGVTVSTTNSCTTYTDSVYVIIHPAPTATVSDSSGIFMDDLLPQQYQSCVPMVFWATQFAPTDQVYWTLGTDTTWSDTMRMDTSGIYRLHLLSVDGCDKEYTMSFTLFPTSVLPNITDASFHFGIGDTLVYCGTSACLTAYLYPDYYVDGQLTSLPLTVHMQYQFQRTCTSTNPAPQTNPYVNAPIQWSLPLTGPGWYTVGVQCTLNALPCDTNTYSFTFLDSIYVLPGEPPQFTASNAFRCTGDTIAIPFQCTNCDSVSWTGPGIVWTSANGDSIRVNADGQYHFVVYNTSAGNTCQTSSYRTVYAPPPPPIYMQPYYGVICPNDSVLLFTTTVGTNYEWTGPGFTTMPNNDSIWTDDPGDYYLTVTHYPGCTATNGPRTVLSFSSPFIEALPTGSICLNGTVDLQVATGPGSTVQWQAPLSGTAFVHTVNAPGTYQCIVSSCGIDWPLSYTVQASGVTAELDTTVYLLCGAEPVTLTGPDGGNIYQWLPSGTTGQSITLNVPGQVQLVVLDAFGCADTSAMISVNPFAYTQPAMAFGDTVCAGGSATVSATGSGDLFWYASADTNLLLSNGSTWTFVPLGSDTVYLLQIEDGCASTFLAVPVEVAPVSPAPSITGVVAYCVGDTLLLIAEASGPPVEWSTPAGMVQGGSIGPMLAQPSAAGLYSCWVVASGCGSDTASVEVDVSLVPDIPVITGDTLLCVGDTLLLVADATGGTVLWQTPSGPFNGTTLTVDGVLNADQGEYLCMAFDGACASAAAMVLVLVDPCTSDTTDFIIPNIFSPNGDGVNDGFFLGGEGIRRVDLQVYNRWGQLMAELSGRSVRWDGRTAGAGVLCSEGVYYWVAQATRNTGENVQLSGYVQLVR